MTTTIKKWGLRALVIIIILLPAASFGWLYFHQKKTAQPEQKVAEQTFPSAEVKQPPAWTKVLLSKQEVDAGVISKSFRQNPTVFLLIKTKETKTENLNLKTTLDDVVKAFVAEVAGFKLTHKGIIKIEDIDALELDYTSPNAEGRTENRMVIVPHKGKTYYLLYNAGAGAIPKTLEDIKNTNKEFVLTIK